MAASQQRKVIVIGGGPAGLMAAGQAASSGADVILLEKMNRPGRKLRITGKGRCNLTNIAPMDDFLQHFHPNGRFLKHTFHRFFTDDLLAFFDQLGIATVTERGGRVFPVSNEAQDIVDALTDWATRQGVHLQTQTIVGAIQVESGQVVGVETSPARGSPRHRSQPRQSHSHAADCVILATGGASYPGTGSTGDGYHIARQVGHTIVPIRPALIPLDTQGDTAARLEGLSLRNVRVNLLIDGKKQDEAFGEMLFTRFGLSGPIILTLSRQAVDALHTGKEVLVSIDLKPALDHPKLDARLLRDLDQFGKRQYQTLLKGLLPRSLIQVCIQQTGIPAEKPGHQITAEERATLRRWLKDFRFEVVGHRPMAQAIVTAGGVNLKEVNPRTMQSKIVRGLFFAGEVLDLDADTGGYNLQAAFSTGWLAGRAAAKSLQRKEINPE